MKNHETCLPVTSLWVILRNKSGFIENVNVLASAAGVLPARPRLAHAVRVLPWCLSQVSHFFAYGFFPELLPQAGGESAPAGAALDQ